jgi:hypothetical protein
MKRYAIHFTLKSNPKITGVVYTENITLKDALDTFMREFPGCFVDEITAA